jgi:very-short-patch-repair endonuclease
VTGQLRSLDGPFLGAAAVAEGHLTAKQLRGPLVRRVFRGVYVPAGTHVDHVVLAQAAGLLVPDDGALSGPTAAAVLGSEPGDRHGPVEVTVPEASRFGPVRGLRVVRSPLALDDTVAWSGTRVTTPVRTAFDLARSRRGPQSLADVDALLRRTGLPAEHARRYLVGRRNHGVATAREILAMADPRAESRPESVVRYHLHRAGLRPTPQLEVRLRCGRRVRFDLAFEAARLAVEYDGAWHALRQQLAADRERLNAVHRDGWAVLHVTAASLDRGPAALVREVRALIASRPSTGR